MLGAPSFQRALSDARSVYTADRGRTAPDHPALAPNAPDPAGRPAFVPDVGEWADQVGVPVGAATRPARVSSPFGLRRHPVLGVMRHHDGVDFAAPRGTPVLATASGTVVAVGQGRGYGLRVEVLHPRSGLVTRYAHLDRVPRGVHGRLWVQRGTVIGYVGSSGLASGPHLHYEVRSPGGRALDPAALSKRYRTSHTRTFFAYRRSRATPERDL